MLATDRSRHVPVRLGSLVGKVHAKAKHVAIAPSVTLNAKLASCVTEACAQAFPTTDRALLRGLPVGWRMNAMCVNSVQDCVVCSVVQLKARRLATVLASQIGTVMLVKAKQSFIADCLDRQHSGTGHCGLELEHDFISLGTAQVK